MKILTILMAIGFLGVFGTSNALGERGELIPGSGGLVVYPDGSVGRIIPGSGGLVVNPDGSVGHLIPGTSETIRYNNQKMEDQSQGVAKRPKQGITRPGVPLSAPYGGGSDNLSNPMAPIRMPGESRR
jgi:hypothetical protein